MEKIYLISEKNIEKAMQKKLKKVIIFKETYKKNFETEFISLTSGEIAADILKITNQKVGSNNKDKAKEICSNFEKESELYLIYSDKIEENLEKKTLLIIENNEKLNQISAQKIYLIPPAPIILEKIRKEYPNCVITALTPEDDEKFKISYYYTNIK